MVRASCVLSLASLFGAVGALSVCGHAAQHGLGPFPQVFPKFG